MSDKRELHQVETQRSERELERKRESVRVNLQPPESSEDLNGLMRVLDNKHSQIQDLQNKIRKLENEQKNFSENKQVNGFDKNDFLSNRRSKL